MWCSEIWWLIIGISPQMILVIYWLLITGWGNSCKWVTNTQSFVIFFKQNYGRKFIKDMNTNQIIISYFNWNTLYIINYFIYLNFSAIMNIFFFFISKKVHMQTKTKISITWQCKYFACNKESNIYLPIMANQYYIFFFDFSNIYLSSSKKSFHITFLPIYVIKKFNLE